jgi:hypothetical protein
MQQVRQRPRFANATVQQVYAIGEDPVRFFFGSLATEDVEVHLQADKILADAVVKLARYLAPFHVLQL